MSLHGKSISEVSAIVQHANRQALLPQLEHDIDRLMDGVRTRVFNAIRTGTFTSALGESAWHEMYAYHRTLQQFKTTTALHSQGENNAS
jgi:hypothetical protein